MGKWFIIHPDGKEELVYEDKPLVGKEKYIKDLMYLFDIILEIKDNIRRKLL